MCTSKNLLIVLAISAGALGAGPAAKTPDACKLLSNSVIEKVQGEPVTQAKPSSGKRGSVMISECLYSLPTSSNSISISLTLPDPGGSKVGPRDVWKHSFHEAESAEDDEDKEKSVFPGEKEKEKETPPRAVSGLGEEAFWVQSFVGTLYVLKGNAFVRISIGGKQDDATRLKKARVLAEAALAKMP
ncbi:MAG: hypothetical protein JOY62_06450 [Acidobacteriaceae bacterium]|nr:hypothetical protein [Acidobacteriaceae bacterium]MBV9779598.1 hypothetical protein [Acidobacteriaceae bacterium]